YLGDSINVQHSSKDGSTFVSKNDLVQLATSYDKTKGAPGGIYRYTGSSGTLDLSNQVYKNGPWVFVRSGQLSAQDYGNSNLWKLVNLTNSNHSEVQAYVSNSSITVHTGDDLSLTASDVETINAVVVAGSAAALSGAGAAADNRIATYVHAGIDGDGSAGLIADSGTIPAHDTPQIRADVVGASIAAAFATDGVAAALSVGVAIADNQISDDVAAYVKNAAHHVTARTGDVVLDAKVLEDP